MATGSLPESRARNVPGICDCDRFLRWYRGDDGILYCHCAHEEGEHLDGKGPCTGEVIRVAPV